MKTGSGEIMWRMDDEYQQQLLYLLQAVQASMAIARRETTYDTVREAWALMDELTDTALPYLPPNYYKAARAWMKNASISLERNPIESLRALIKAKYNVIAGLRAIGLVGRRYKGREDIEEQAKKMLLEAIEKRKDLLNQKVELEEKEEGLD